MSNTNSRKRTGFGPSSLGIGPLPLCLEFPAEEDLEVEPNLLGPRGLETWC